MEAKKPAKKLPKVLLVEDDSVLAEMYLDKFNEAGIETILALDAEEGLRTVKKERPDLVVLDILLPRANGIFFLEKLREDPKTASIPVLAFSNYDDPNVKKRALALGAKDYLIKANYTPKEIIRQIKSYLN